MPPTVPTHNHNLVQHKLVLNRPTYLENSWLAEWLYSLHSGKQFERELLQRTILIDYHITSAALVKEGGVRCTLNYDKWSMCIGITSSYILSSIGNH